MHCFREAMTYSEHAHSICMYHMHDSFGKRTELLMHELADATSGALQTSSGILEALGGMDTQMQGTSITHDILMCVSEASWI